MARRHNPTRAFRLSRASEMDANPQTFASRANTFAQSFTGRDYGTLLVKKTTAGVESYLLTNVGSDQPVRNLAFVVGAKFAEVEPPELDTDSVGHLVLDSDGATARETTSGIDPTELSRHLVNLIPEEGAWVAITFRATTSLEKKRHKAWLSFRLGTQMPTHHTAGLTAVVTKILAGSSSDDTTRLMLEQLTRALPGFDLETRPRTPSPLSEALPWLLGALAAAGLFGGLYFWKPALALSIIMATLLGSVATFCLTVALGKWRGWALMRGHWLDLAVANEDTDFSAPGKWRGWRYKKPRRESMRKDKVIPERPGDYPFAKDTFCVGPTVIAGLVAPQAGVASGERLAELEEVPPVFFEDIGPFIATTSKGQKVHLSAEDTLFGTAIVGKPGSGKSRLIHALFAWSMAEKVAPSNRRGFPGAKNTLIAFESKGGGMPSYREWSKTIGDDLLVIDLNRPDSYSIDFLDVPGTFNERANFFVNAMIYAFGREAIGDRSFRTLTTAIAGSLCVTDEVAGSLATVDLDKEIAGPLYYANVMMGAKGYKPAIELISAVLAHSNKLERDVAQIREALGAGSYRDAASRTKAERYVAWVGQYVEAAQGLRDLSERTEANFKTYVEAPANKTFQLLESAGRSWFSTARPKMSWKDILEQHKTVVINTGASEMGDAVPDKFSQQISSMLLFSLKENIARHCVEWLSVGRSVSIFSDELSLLAGHSSEVLQWVRDQGRSFGVRPFFATQRPEQLPQDVRSVFLNFATLISFAQDERKTAAEIAAAMETDGDWTADMIVRLPPFHPAIRAQYQLKRQMAFSASVTNFEADRAGFAASQGNVIHQPEPEQPSPSPATGELEQPRSERNVSPFGHVPSRQGQPSSIPNDDDYPDLSQWS